LAYVDNKPLLFVYFVISQESRGL